MRRTRRGRRKERKGSRNGDGSRWSGSQTFEDGDVFACAVDGVDGHSELELASEQLRKFREAKAVGRSFLNASAHGIKRVGGEDLRSLARWHDVRVLDEVLERSLGYPLQRRGLCTRFEHRDRAQAADAPKKPKSPE